MIIISILKIILLALLCVSDLVVVALLVKILFTEI